MSRLQAIEKAHYIDMGHVTKERDEARAWARWLYRSNKAADSIITDERTEVAMQAAYIDELKARLEAAERETIEANESAIAWENIASKIGATANQQEAELSYLRGRLEAAEAEVARLREALRIYADKVDDTHLNYMIRLGIIKPD